MIERPSDANVYTVKPLDGLGPTKTIQKSNILKSRDVVKKDNQTEGQKHDTLKADSKKSDQSFDTDYESETESVVVVKKYKNSSENTRNVLDVSDVEHSDEDVLEPGDLSVEDGVSEFGDVSVEDDVSESNYVGDEDISQPNGDENETVQENTSSLNRGIPVPQSEPVCRRSKRSNAAKHRNPNNLPQSV